MQPFASGGMVSENGMPPNKKRHIAWENGSTGSAGEFEFERPDGDLVSALQCALVDFHTIDAGPVPAVQVLDLVPFLRFVDDRVLVGDERVVETDIARYCPAKGRVLLFNRDLKTRETAVGYGKRCATAISPSVPLSRLRVKNRGIAAFPSTSFSCHNNTFRVTGSAVQGGFVRLFRRNTQ